MGISPTPENGWYLVGNAAEVPSPALLVYPDRIAANIRLMVEIAGGAGRLRPHVKTHKMPGIIRLQMEQGISKFKCATISETEMVAGCGVKDIILAMQPVGPNLERFFRLKREFPYARISCIADCKEVVLQLSDMALKSGLETHVWLDINNGMDRTGIRPGKEAEALAKLTAGMPMLRLEGLHVYDGHIKEADFSERKKICDEAFVPVTELAEELDKSGISAIKIVAGGTPTFPVHALRKGVECSPGTTVLWDYISGSSFAEMEFLYAAVLLTRIISKPAEGLVCLDLGHKAVASEMPQPRIKILGLDDYTITGHSEEHMVVRTTRADNMKTGDVLYAVPWHICPTTDRYDTVSVVKDGMVTGEWKVAARKRKITV